jgi:hypothetical protein
MSNAIEALMNDDPAAFREEIRDMLMMKLGERLDQERMDMSSSFFDTPEQEEYE